MLPHKHFAISGLTIAAVTYVAYPEKSAIEIGEWVLVGGVLSAAIDLDVYALVYIRSGTESRLKPFRNLWNIFRNFGLFKDTIAGTGVLKMGIISHFIVSAFLGLFFYFFSGSYFMPAMLGIISHMISDIPNYRRLIIKG